MVNNITTSDINSLKKFLSHKKILTQSENVSKFEKEWSKWLGVKYSVFVNSGSTANYISMAILKNLNKKGEIIVPTLTWVSDISSVLLNNFKPVFVDINLKNLSADENQIIKKINKNTAAVFLTHAQGFNGLSSKLLAYLKKKKIPLIEDVCESHGATFKNKKLGCFGLISNFSFYYAHHLTTIEGGMICTNNSKIYNMARILRSHGMLRESLDKNYINLKKKEHTDLNPDFIFLFPTLNFRSNELNAIIGLNQIKTLNKNNKLRNQNFNFFLKNIDSKKFYTDFDIKGCSNYAFPLILKSKDFSKRNKLEKIMNKFKIEFRRGNAGGGNQLKQPYIKKYIKKYKVSDFKNVDHVHSFGYYIGNFPSLKIKKIKRLCNILNTL
ncbi:MAG: CDP-4-keto-6-deoxy-D-glucose-3-dehydrase [Flammeovirgaceae bacterium]|nr:CDP-4-keto-6-deoxy-D-glucose-3-dehydrase [Flammeovirgaceae bacterium]